MSTPVKLRNVDRFTDQNGKPRHYYRRGHGPRVRLVGEPGSPEYMQAYYAAAVAACAPAAVQSAEAPVGGTESSDGELPGAVRP